MVGKAFLLLALNQLIQVMNLVEFEFVLSKMMFSKVKMMMSPSLKPPIPPPES